MYVLRRSWPFPGKLPSKRSSPTVGLSLLSGGVSLNKASSTTLLPVRLQWAARRHDGMALLDSRAEGNLLDISLAQLLHIPMVSLHHKISVSALNGQSLPEISLSMVPITLITSGNHSETITFLVTNSPLASVVLGHPWLTQHNPRWIGVATPSLSGVKPVMPLVLCLLFFLFLVLCCRVIWGACQTCPRSIST